MLILLLSIFRLLSLSFKESGWQTLPPLHSPIQASVLDRFGDVAGSNLFRSLEVGDGAADFKNPTVGSRA